MSRERELAEELYPDWEYTGVPKIDGLEQSEVRIQRVAYIKGYHQAEKDNELTWEDLATIEKLGDDFIKQNHTPMSDEEFFKEILKRFKERKEK